MTSETKLVFDQLTEDADKLIPNGDYNVYHEEQEVFQHEAEGYERLAQARANGTESFDMFGDDEDTPNPSSALPSGPPPALSSTLIPQLLKLAHCNMGRQMDLIMCLTNLQGTTTAAALVTTMTLTLDFTAPQQPENDCKGSQTTLPSAGLFIIIYHSFYALHESEAYKHVMKDEDKYKLYNMKWLKVFNKIGLCSKSKVRINMEEVKPYYLSLINKYFMAKLKW